MSAIIEIWKNKGKILEGIKNRIFTTEDIKHIALKRYAKCIDCKHIDEKGKSCVMPGTQPCCKLCGCCLKIKIYSMSSECPAPEKHWEAMMSEEEEDLLNENLN